MAAGLAQLGFLTWEVVLISIVGTLFVQAGIQLGSRVRNSLKPDAFRRLILIFLMLVGISLVARLFVI